MHHILGGNNPTARPITDLLGNIYSGQVPFARPLGFISPKDGVAIPNGATPTVDISGVPLGTFAATSFAGGNKNAQTVTPRSLGRRAMMEGGEHGDKWSVQDKKHQVTTFIPGGTGKFKNASGFRALFPHTSWSACCKWCRDTA
ncbi:hypothetical protein K7X08_030522 [Anisodus acutangulus]|uniref:Uncharacterized protein n=1 Tax=Anisodus acutangulus TaxID=402998 RepID=A0A9Q1RLJ9_9SOLA|nr:hypothetical protein K7X08_030522 [Anisodus acutangulus]